MFKTAYRNLLLSIETPNVCVSPSSCSFSLMDTFGEGGNPCCGARLTEVFKTFGMGTGRSNGETEGDGGAGESPLEYDRVDEGGGGGGGRFVLTFVSLVLDLRLEEDETVRRPGETAGLEASEGALAGDVCIGTCSDLR